MIKIVWTNGCFDILHRGHLEMLKYAKSLGDYVIVGIDSDDKVAKDKGPSRPFNKVEDRKFALKSLKYVDEVVVFDSAEKLEIIIRSISPHVMIIGSDWKGKTVIGESFCGELRFFDRIGDYSTTNILEFER
jgi:D-beta-D-heptose 7-phosphate kinase/D-beta-D-heptose 1-phosphate adenosyltransferase|tara:strand:+ start:2644 stop:3039 length:396 start_codon:yes stop_codon:yes gene_type:complete